jgi:hypothetical protein
MRMCIIKTLLLMHQQEDDPTDNGRARWVMRVQALGGRFCSR